MLNTGTSQSPPPAIFYGIRNLQPLHISLSEEGTSYTNPKVSPLPFHNIFIDLSDLSMVEKLATNKTSNSDLSDSVVVNFHT